MTSAPHSGSPASAGAAFVRVRPATLMTLALVASCFSGHWDQFGLPLGPDRLLFLGSLVSLILRREFDVSLLRRRHLTVALLGAYGLGSLAVNGMLTEPRPFFALMDGLGLVPFAAYALAPMMYRRRDDLRILRSALVAMAAYLGATAVLEMIGPSALVFPRYIMDEQIGIHFGRARGPFTAAAPMGLALSLGAGAATLAARGARSTRQRVMYWGVALMAALGIVLTLTRAIWLGAAIASLAVALLHPAGRRAAAKAIPVGVVAVIAAVLLLPGVQTRVAERSSAQRPVWDRLNTNAAALNIIEDHPLFGVGFQRFKAVAPDFVEQHPDYPLTRADIDVHNVVLSVGAELGLVGVVLYCAAFGVCIVVPLSRRRHAAIDEWRYFAMSFAITWVVSAMFAPVWFALPNLALWLLAGIVDGMPPAQGHPFHDSAVAVRPRPVAVPS